MYISRQINEQLSETAMGSMLQDAWPKQRFFVPTDKFWQQLKQIKQDNDISMFIDCGTGDGDLPKEAWEIHEIKMGGVDLYRREGNAYTDVQIIPAHRIPFSQSIWALTCRPDHSGWVRALLEKCIDDGAGFIYVGLRRNMTLDLGPHLIETPFDVYDDCGEDGEQMLVLKS